MTMPDGAARQLNGASEWLEFRSQQQLAEAVGYLLGCHRHHFAVITGDRWSIVASSEALKCIESHFAASGSRVERND